jgi:hypothetical protein
VAAATGQRWRGMKGSGGWRLGARIGAAWRAASGGGIGPEATQHEEQRQAEAATLGGDSKTQQSRLRASAHWVTSGGGGV